MTENYNVGQIVYFDYKGRRLEAEVTRVNQKTLSIVAKDAGIKGRIGYGLISTEKIATQADQACPQLERSEYYSQKDLENIMEEVKQEYAEVFDEEFDIEQKALLDSVRIIWGTQYTYRLLGQYRYSRLGYGENHNIIRMSKSLQHTPKFVIGKTLYHELLHIKFHGHGPVFRMHERKFKDAKEADIYTHTLCKEIKDHGIYRLARLPKAQKKEVVQKVNQTVKQPVKKETMNKQELKDYCRKHNIKGFSTLRKPELEKLVESYNNKF